MKPLEIKLSTADWDIFSRMRTLILERGNETLKSIKEGVASKDVLPDSFRSLTSLEDVSLSLCFVSSSAMTTGAWRARYIQRKTPLETVLPLCSEFASEGETRE